MSRLATLALVCLALSTAAAAQSRDIPKTRSGRPDLSGTYDVSTLTPMERPAELGEKMALTDEEAAELAERTRQAMALANRDSDPNRGAPPQGGDGSPGASGNVGGYNAFWIDPGEGAFQIDGQWRTSILIDPPNGRYPPRVEGANTGRGGGRANDGTAYWLEAGVDAPGPYDDMEQRPYAERCILSFGSTSGPPMLPSLYNNHKRIVQGEDTVLILIEMVHDARIVRMNAEHDPPEIKKWLGDSIGWWEGDTLVVDTTNLYDKNSFTNRYGATPHMRLVERFTRVDAETLIYEFTVEDSATWTRPWTVEVPMAKSEDKLWEFACHEGNYGMDGILAGHRAEERDAARARR